MKKEEISVIMKLNLKYVRNEVTVHVAVSYTHLVSEYSAVGEGCKNKPE